jgi:hypothetical protein
MKRLIFTFTLIICFGIAKSQNEKAINLQQYDSKPIHFGFGLGVSRMNFNVKSNSLISDSINVSSAKNYGFNFGVTTNFRLNNFFDIRFTPAISFIRQSLNFNVINNINIIEVPFNIQSTNLVLPLFLKIKYKRFRNVRPYFILGGNYRFNFNANKSNISSSLIKLNDSDFSFEFGLGMDHFFKYYKFSPELKFSLGLQNLNSPIGTIYSRAIDKMTSRIFILNFFFE